jgi:hypothetical protein
MCRFSAHADNALEKEQHGQTSYPSYIIAVIVSLLLLCIKEVPSLQSWTNLLLLNVLEIASACKTDLAMTVSGFLLSQE